MAKVQRVKLVSPADLSDVSVTPTNSRVDFRIDSDGQIYFQQGVGAGFISQYTWLLSGSNADYEARISGISGDDPGGSALNTWIATTADITWNHIVVVVNAVASTSTVEIRDKTTLEILATMTLNMDAEEA